MSCFLEESTFLAQFSHPCLLIPPSGEVDGMKSVGGSAEPSSRGAEGQPVYTMEHMLPILRRCGSFFLFCPTLFQPRFDLNTLLFDLSQVE